jgi:hypothetical protein
VKVLVCGSRAYRDRLYAFQVLDALHRKHTFTVVVHGDAGGLMEVRRGAPKVLVGADKLAGQWARERGIPERAYPVSQAEWDAVGAAAGPMRNRRMLERESPELCVAFPGGRGTHNMVVQARLARVPIFMVPPSIKALVV